jgi:hypothetical protein
MFINEETIEKKKFQIKCMHFFSLLGTISISIRIISFSANEFIYACFKEEREKKKP